MIHKDVVQYQTLTGKVPFLEWLNAFKDGTIRAKIRARIDRLRLGHFGDSKSVGLGVGDYSETIEKLL